MMLENEEKMLLIFMDIKSLLTYQTQLLETMVSNSDEMMKRKNNFDPKEKIKEIQKIIPEGIDLEKIFNMVQKKG